MIEAANVYDEEGRVVEQLSPFGRRTRLAYLPGRVTVTSDDQGGPANTFVHDVEGRLLAIVDGDDQRLSCNYDQWGNPVVITQRGGGVTIQQWDERSRLRAPGPAHRRDPDVRLRRRRPHDRERMLDGRDHADALRRRGALPGRGRRSGGRRDRVHRLQRPGHGDRRPGWRAGALRARSPTARSSRRSTPTATRLAWSATRRGAWSRRLSPLGRRTELRYDEHGRIVERRDPSGGVWSYEHTTGGRLSADRRSVRRARGVALRRARAAHREGRRARADHRRAS